MNSPTDDYNFMKNVDGIWDTAYFTLFEKYMKLDLRGQEKLIEIDSVDQESMIMKKNGGFPIPGMVYTFLYKGPDVEVANPPKKPKVFKDLVPIVFCMGTEKDGFSGINMNALPPGVRLQFLQSFYDTFRDFLEREADVLSQNNKLALNKRFMKFIRSGKGQEMIKIYNTINGANFNFAYRRYNLKKVKQLRMIEYPEWKYIPFYEPKDAFRKLNYSQIYKLYGKSK